VDEATVRRYIAETFDGLDVVEANGDAFYFYDPGRNIPPDRRLPFATLVTGDRYDQVSDLDRPGVYRLNIGISKETFQSLFGASGADEDAEPDYDLTVLDTVMPHPVYGRMSWVCVLNPSEQTFETVRRLLAEAYDLAARRHTRTRRSELPSS